MSDEIRIQELEIYSHHGVFQEEKKLGQKFLVSATLMTNTRKAGQTDCLEDAIDYGKACHFIGEIMEEHVFNLIETAAETIANRLLITFPTIEAVDVEVKKPWAPIGMPIDSVAVKIHRSWHRVYLSIGSNMGDREGFLNQGIKALEAAQDIRVICCSSVLETKPYGDVKQDDFLNACLAIDTTMSPEELLDYLHQIENEAGRERTLHWGPRTLDLDILFYDDKVIMTKDLVIPHQDMIHRDFVLTPLCEIAPYMIHPVYGKAIVVLKHQLEKDNCS